MAQRPLSHEGRHGRCRRGMRSGLVGTQLTATHVRAMLGTCGSRRPVASSSPPSGSPHRTPRAHRRLHRPDPARVRRHRGDPPRRCGRPPGDGVRHLGTDLGAIRPVIDRVFDGLDEMSAVHRYLESNAQVGKMVVRVRWALTSSEAGPRRSGAPSLPSCASDDPHGEVVEVV
ncbi:zinc-binding dehydrogenase [Streptomyces sp. NPDC058691]|uniref:zinc-binding dehydrogenase n=1 Tax=Streptomyces sp. NPDC058691 TaxID=3346601 RepID=UPI0036514CC5